MTAGNVRFPEFCSPFVDAKMRQGSVGNGQWLQHAFWKVSEENEDGRKRQLWCSCVQDDR